MPTGPGVSGNAVGGLTKGPFFCRWFPTPNFMHKIKEIIREDILQNSHSFACFESPTKIKLPKVI